MPHTATLTDVDDVENLRVETEKHADVLRVVLHGECDFSRIQELSQALPTLDPDTARLVQLDLTHLAFADTATIRRLAVFAGHARRTGHDVQTFGAHPTMARVADLLHVQLDLGLS